MTDEQIIKALECCSNIEWSYCCKCPYREGGIGCITRLANDALALVKRQEAEIRRLEYTLLGVMHSVDKWLEGDELKQDEVNRAITMREKTLRIVESLQAENEEQDQAIINALHHMKVVRAEGRTEAIREFEKEVIELFPSDKKFTTISRASILQITRKLTEVEK